MNVHPSTGFNPQGPTRQDPFAPDALYEIKIDTNGDAVADITYRAVLCIRGRRADRNVAPRRGRTSHRDRRGWAHNRRRSAGLHDREARVTDGSDHRFFAGWRSDPFFFDVTGALKDFQFTGNDYFIDKDVCSIVLEVPNSALGAKTVGLWARTVDGASGRWVQADRGARPSQAVFLPGDERDAYLSGTPADDARFIDVFAHSLQHTGGYSSEDARGVAVTLLPDILRFDPTRAASYPSNGRALTDDVLDGFISILTNGKVTTDGVGAHSDLLTEFPYVGPPHRATAR